MPACQMVASVTYDEIRLGLETGVMRLGEQQKKLLVWMLEQELSKTWLSDEPTTISYYMPKEIPWNSGDFLGHSPTTKKSSTLSKTLSTLEERKLITLKRGEGKKPRTTHIALTTLGRLVAEGLKKGYTIGNQGATKPSSTINEPDRLTAVDLSLTLLKRELVRVEAALDQKAQDFSSLDVTNAKGEVAKTRRDVEAYQTSLKGAVKTFEAERAEFSKKFNDVLMNWLQSELST
jgi:DNA-binding MarR family transcriptional regulator